MKIKNTKTCHPDFIKINGSLGLAYNSILLTTLEYRYPEQKPFSFSSDDSATTIGCFLSKKNLVDRLDKELTAFVFGWVCRHKS